MKCKDEAGLHEEYSRVIRMCVGTKVGPRDCVKLGGICRVGDWTFTNTIKEYTFALAIVEDKPAFEGDVLYGISGEAHTLSGCLGDKTRLQARHSTFNVVRYDILIACLSWNQPKKKTFLLNGEELPAPTGLNLLPTGRQSEMLSLSCCRGSDMTNNTGLCLAIAALKRIANCEDAPDIDATGEWQFGLHCGVEDRDCQDRYDGADFGHAVGVGKGLEWASNEAKAALEALAIK